MVGWSALSGGYTDAPIPAGVREDPDIAWQAPLLSLQWIMNHDVHLGGESALGLAGFSHYLSLGHVSRVHAYGDVPSWLRRLPTRTQFVVHRRALFGDDLTGIIEADRDPPIRKFGGDSHADDWHLALANQGIVAGASHS